jgi:hypothetical protein
MALGALWLIELSCHICTGIHIVLGKKDSATS